MTFCWFILFSAIPSDDVRDYIQLHHLGKVENHRPLFVRSFSEKESLWIIAAILFVAVIIPIL